MQTALRASGKNFKESILGRRRNTLFRFFSFAALRRTLRPGYAL